MTNELIWIPAVLAAREYPHNLIFYLFGALILLYVIFTVIKRWRLPKTGEKKANVMIETIEKIRVPVKADSIRNRQVMVNEVMPFSIYQVVFRDLKTNEVYSFSVKTENGEEFKEKQSGWLTYNGGNFISFEKSA